MHPLHFFGLPTKPLKTQGLQTTGTVLYVRTCWWFKVNALAARLSPWDGARFAHILCVSYTVNNVLYTVRRFVLPLRDCPHTGEPVPVLYNKARPGRACILL